MLAWLGGFPTERILRALPRLQASAILATTSFGVYLSDHCRELVGCAPSELGVRKFVSGGEPGLGQPEIRAKISAGWGTSHIRECMGIGDVMEIDQETLLPSTLPSLRAYSIARAVVIARPSFQTASLLRLPRVALACRHASSICPVLNEVVLKDHSRDM